MPIPRPRPSCPPQPQLRAALLLSESQREGPARHCQAGPGSGRGVQGPQEQQQPHPAPPTRTGTKRQPQSSPAKPPGSRAYRRGQAVPLLTQLLALSTGLDRTACPANTFPTTTSWSLSCSQQSSARKNTSLSAWAIPPSRPPRALLGTVPDKKRGFPSRSQHPRR